MSQDLQTNYPLFRSSLGAEYAGLTDEELDTLAAHIYGEGIGAEDVEGFFDDIGHALNTAGHAVGNFAKQAAPVVASAVPGIIQGATTGATVGGPWGALVGGLVGGAGSALAHTNNPTLRTIGNTVSGVTNMVSSVTGGGGAAGGALGSLANVAMGALGGAGGGAPAAPAPRLPPSQAGAGNQLLGMLSRPETVQALLSSSLGNFGRQSVPIGGQSVPVQSILATLGSLVQRTQGEAVDNESTGLPAYLYGEDGELAVDPADPDQRADALLGLYARTPRPTTFDTPAQAPAAYTPVVVATPDTPPSAPATRSRVPRYTSADALYDEMLWQSLEDERFAESLEAVDD